MVFGPFVKHAYADNKEKMDKVAALFEGEGDLYAKLTAFLKTINLDKHLRDYNVSDEDFKEMLASPMLDHLPFGDREFLENILKEAR